MRIKHWAGYGCVNARKVKENNPFILHIKVEGNHECGLVREDEYELYNWLVKRFDHDVQYYPEWHKLRPIIDVRPGWRRDLNLGVIDTCDYYFT